MKTCWRKFAFPIIMIWLCITLACNFQVVRTTPFALPEGSTPVLQFPTPLPPATRIPTQTMTTPPGAPLFAGLTTATPEGNSTENQPTLSATADFYTYQAQSGDTLDAVAKRFGVPPEQVTSGETLPSHGLIPPGQFLLIPNLIGDAPYPSALLPDSEVIYSPTSLDFNIANFVSRSGGYLSTYSQTIGLENLSGAEIVQRVAENTSINPRLLLALIEFRSHWVSSLPTNPDITYPLGFQIPGYEGLFLELSLAAKLLNIGYYGWRQGSLTQLEFTDGTKARLAPQLNAGSVAVQYLFARLYKQRDWQDQLYRDNGLIHLYEKMFGNPWARAATVEPLFPPGLQPPTLELPFAPGETWSLTAGPHSDWNTGTPPGALDFAPITGEPPCAVSTAWARASAPGIVIRASDGVILLDLDGDGREQTGWVLLYLHIAQKERVAPGTHVNTGDPIGHPSCEGGEATGTHVHLAKKYNGEWIGAGEPFPLVLSGWTALPGVEPYEGSLVKDGQVVSAHPDGSSGSTIIH